MHYKTTKEFKGTVKELDFNALSMPNEKVKSMLSTGQLISTVEDLKAVKALNTDLRLFLECIVNEGEQIEVFNYTGGEYAGCPCYIISTEPVYYDNYLFIELRENHCNRNDKWDIYGLQSMLSFIAPLIINCNTPAKAIEAMGDDLVGYFCLHTGYTTPSDGNSHTPLTKKVTQIAYNYLNTHNDAYLLNYYSETAKGLVGLLEWWFAEKKNKMQNINNQAIFMNFIDVLKSKAK